jgi:hypothetical protein
MSQEPEGKFAFLNDLKKAAIDKEPGTEDSSGQEASARGRRHGKRRDPAFEQVTAYIRRDTHHAVKLAILKEGTNRQFSDLVEALLVEWLTKAI